jgi:hypothetical protein
LYDGGTPKSLNSALEKGISVFVSLRVLRAPWKVLAGEGSYTVLTTIDGQVIYCLGHNLPAGAIACMGPLETVLVVGGLARLGAGLATRAVKTLSRRAGLGGPRTLFAGPSDEVARQAVRLQAAQTARPASIYIPESGLTRAHFGVFQQAAKETDLIAVVRHSKQASTRLIEMGCPAKPMTIKFGTDSRTGVVTAASKEEIWTAYKNGYFVIHADGVARRAVMGRFRNGKQVYEELKLKDPFWKVETGQLIDANLKKPLVSDYDLMGVFSAKASGRNLVLAADDGSLVLNRVSPEVRQFAKAVNDKLASPRVLHGAQDQYAGFRGGATAFYPDGSVRFLKDEAAVQAFYKEISRETITGSYRRSVPSLAPSQRTPVLKLVK